MIIIKCYCQDKFNLKQSLNLKYSTNIRDNDLKCEIKRGLLNELWHWSEVQNQIYVFLHTEWMKSQILKASAFRKS